MREEGIEQNKKITAIKKKKMCLLPLSNDFKLKYLSRRKNINEKTNWKE